MPKFLIITEQVVERTYEVIADDADQAASMARDGQYDFLEPVEETDVYEGLPYVTGVGPFDADGVLGPCEYFDSPLKLTSA